MNANEIQIGGDHYRSRSIQCWDFIVAQQLEYLPGCVVKYVSRYREKNGLQDLKKARHYLDKLIEVEEERERGRVMESEGWLKKKQEEEKLDEGECISVGGLFYRDKEGLPMESGYFLFNTMTHKIFGTTSYTTPEEAQKAIEAFEVNWQDNPKDRRDLAVVSVRYDEVVGVPKEEVPVQESPVEYTDDSDDDYYNTEEYKKNLEEAVQRIVETSESIIPAPVLKKDSGFGHPFKKDVIIGEGIAEHLNHHKESVGITLLVADLEEGFKTGFRKWYIIDRKSDSIVSGPFLLERVARAAANVMMEVDSYKTSYPDGLKVEER